MGDFLDRENARNVRTCDSCGQFIDQAAEPGRWRHKDCPVPPMPSEMQRVMAEVRAKTKGSR